MSGDSPFPEAVDASGLKIAIAAARFNGSLVGSLLARVQSGLSKAGVAAANIHTVRVPGSNELPVAAKLLIDHAATDAVIALGVVIRGGTMHYELIAQATTGGLMEVALASGVPVINGVIVAENKAQATARCSGRIDRGSEFAQAAVAMATLRKELSR